MYDGDNYAYRALFTNFRWARLDLSVYFSFLFNRRFSGGL